MEATNRCSIVCLAKIAIDTACACGVDDSAVLLLQHVGIGGLGDPVRSLQMNIQDGIPEVIGHIRERFVFENASIVDDDVNLELPSLRVLEVVLGYLDDVGWSVL